MKLVNSLVVALFLLSSDPLTCVDFLEAVPCSEIVLNFEATLISLSALAVPLYELCGLGCVFHLSKPQFFIFKVRVILNYITYMKWLL